MIVVVAPYSPIGRAAEPHLGAARKLELIISLLSQLDSQVVLVNSAHNGQQPAPFAVRTSEIRQVTVTEVIPEVYRSRRIGKLRNIWDVPRLVRMVQGLGIPRLYWFYNAYAFEMRFALGVGSSTPVPMVLEFEDWHFARKRGLSPKPFVDYCFWRRAMSAHVITHAFAVNSILRAELGSHVRETVLLPGVVPEGLAKIATEQPPFPCRGPGLRIGFFGGLSSEKGADLVLRLVPRLDPNHVLFVSGCGPLERDFVACSRRWPEKLKFFGAVDETTLYGLIGGADVVLNPHVDLEDMKFGVLPFKAIEAIASGRLVVSTDFPASGLEDIAKGVRLVPHSDDAFLAAIQDARGFYLEHKNVIAASAARANARFGEATLLECMGGIIDGPEAEG